MVTDNTESARNKNNTISGMGQEIGLWFFNGFIFQFDSIIHLSELLMKQG